MSVSVTVGNAVYLTLRLVGTADVSIANGTQLLVAFTSAFSRLLFAPDAVITVQNYTLVGVGGASAINNGTQGALSGRRQLQSTGAGAIGGLSCMSDAVSMGASRSDTLFVLRAVLPAGLKLNSSRLAELLSDTPAVALRFHAVARVWFNCTTPGSALGNAATALTPSPTPTGVALTTSMLPGGVLWPFRALDGSSGGSGSVVPFFVSSIDTVVDDSGAEQLPSQLSSASSRPVATAAASASVTASATLPASVTLTRTKKPRPAVPSGTFTDSPSPSLSASIAATPTATQTACPASMPLPPLPSRVLTVVRLGDVAHPAPTSTAGTALPVYIDILALNGTRLGTRPLTTRTASGCGQPCTLAMGQLGASSTSWFWDTEGLPSTTADGSAVILPCHTSPVGAPAPVMLNDQKTIAILRRATMAVDTSMRFTANTGQRGTGTGLRQAASVDGRSFWLAGVAATWSGVRYLPSRSSTLSEHLHGQTLYSDVPGRTQVATRDVRGMAIANGKLYMSSAFVSEPSANGVKDPYRPWGGVVQLSTGLPTTAFGADGAKLLPGFTGRRNWQSFTFVGTADLWALEDMSTYRSVTTSAAAANHARTALSTVLTHFKYDAVKKTWTEVATHRVSLGASAFYSLSALASGTTTQLYATDRAQLVSVTVTAGGAPVKTTLATPPTGGHFRGVAAF
jgi:hypothetical protein